MPIPLKGDRGAFDVTNYATLHASDLEAAAPKVHVPVPGAAGTVPVSDGTKWVAGAPDASAASYTPGVLTDWDGDADPGDVDNALDQLAARTDDLEDIDTYSKEPTGFINTTSSTLSFSAVTLKVSLAVVSGSYSFYSGGNLFVKTTTQEKAIADTEGLHYIYFDTSGVLSEGVVAWDIASANVPVACVYWDGSAGILMDERHGIQMDGRTHEYLHETRGPAFAFGLAGTFAADGSAITIGSGEWYDDDIELEPAEQTTCRMFWLNGTTWNWTAAQAAYFHAVGSVPQYNNAGALANVDANKYSTSWVFHTNHTTTPVAVIMGQAQYNTKAQAEAAGLPNLSTLPAAEMLLLYKVVWQRNGAVITWKSTADYRRTSGGAVANYVATDHGALAGLTDDDHPQYFLETDTQTANTVYAGPDSGAAAAPTFRALTAADLPAGTMVTDILYADLATAIAGDDLVPLAWYRITDFSTKHWIISSDPAEYFTDDDNDVITGANEPLLVQAISTGALGTTCLSETYPADILRYDWDPANWTTDPSIYEPSEMGLVSGFKGVITYRHDTISDNSAYYDWRNAKTRRWAAIAPAWSAGSYDAGSLVTVGNYIYYAVVTTSGQPPASHDWSILVSITGTLGVYWGAASWGISIIPCDPDDHIDILTFPADLSDVKRNHLGPGPSVLGKLCVIGSACQDNTIVFPSSHDIDSNSWSNTLGPNCERNVLAAWSVYNVLGSYCSDNLFGYGAVANNFMIAANGNVLCGSCAAIVTVGSNINANVFGQGCQDFILGANESSHVFAYGTTGRNYFSSGHTYAELDSTGADAGDVLTADGSGNSAWAAPAAIVDARCDDAVNTSTWDSTTAGVLDALRDAMIAHGLIAAS
jgi:hypothetical protein